MNKHSEVSDRTILEELGKSITWYRLNQNLTQEEFAQESGVGVNTIYRIETGNSIQLSNFIRILQTLGIVNQLEALIEHPPVSPVEQVKLQKKERRRASPRKNKRHAIPWKWDEDR